MKIDVSCIHVDGTGIVGKFWVNGDEISEQSIIGQLYGGMPGRKLDSHARSLLAGGEKSADRLRLVRAWVGILPTLAKWFDEKRGKKMNENTAEYFVHGDERRKDG